ncbi:hypothetical protein GCK72_002238 [Caenorhabditis remanei]|uniref:Uncharacterized protein n=1 Tax=Caenorhabditis remanei TaxID=31234 RepID=A0A6A5HQD4_CAERE|nr:hypothetical protein GCK72_002238 [Caenorhabditis remanei]KAF1770420.1 hypothetical protein GCK72_002238 [Caenorhabditis remanei]
MHKPKISIIIFQQLDILEKVVGAPLQRLLVERIVEVVEHTMKEELDNWLDQMKEEIRQNYFVKLRNSGAHRENQLQA